MAVRSMLVIVVKAADGTSLAQHVVIIAKNSFIRPSQHKGTGPAIKAAKCPSGSCDEPDTVYIYRSNLQQVLGK